MELKIIFIYCFCADFMNYLGIKSDPQCKMNKAEIMTVAITAALFYGGNFSMAEKFLCGMDILEICLVKVDLIANYTRLSFRFGK